MAFSGLHLACGFAGGQGRNGRAVSVLKNIVFSQTMAAPGTSTNPAPAPTEADGDPLFRISVSAASFVAIGPAPDAVNGPRSLMNPGDPVEFLINPGDKIAWVLA